LIGIYQRAEGAITVVRLSTDGFYCTGRREIRARLHTYCNSSTEMLQ
jgi:hypothetical protein